ncbi:MAG: AAA family ATPase [Fimbriimonas sp.]
MRPTALLLCGLPYSGKSTLAESLIIDGYFVISLDAINHERGLGLDGQSVPGSEWMETHRIALERLRAYLQAGHNVIWDDTNYAAWIRDPIFEAALESGAEPLVVLVDTPVEIVRRRAEEAKAQGRPVCPEEDFERVVRDFERPCCVVRIDGTQPLEGRTRTLRQALSREPVPQA